MFDIIDGDKRALTKSYDILLTLEHGVKLVQEIPYIDSNGTLV